MAYIKNTIFSQLVATTGTYYRHVSEHLARHLPRGHAYSTKRWPHDQADGMLGSAQIQCNDAYFFTNERQTGLAAGSLVATNVVALAEWPVMGRIREARFRQSVAADVSTGRNTAYLPAGASAIFPLVTTLRVADPADSTFTPFALLDANGDLSVDAITFGVNRRPNPLIIEMVMSAAPPANSWAYLRTSFALPRQ